MERKRRFAEIALDDEFTERQHADGSEQNKLARTLEEDDEMMDEILKIVDSAAEVAPIDTGRLTTLVATLEKAILKNQQMRVKYADEPRRFMESEQAVDEAVKSMHELAAAPYLYSKFVRLNGARLFVTLLAHENTDIVLDVITLLNELTDPSSVMEDENALELIETLMDLNVFHLLIQNLARLTGSEEDVRGIYQTLGVLENITEIEPEYCLRLCNSTKILRFLVSNIQKNAFNENNFYCAELLAMFLNIQNSLSESVGKLNIVTILVEVFKGFLRKPIDSKEQLEYCENLFDILAVCFNLKEIKSSVIETGCLLMLIRMIHKKRLQFRSGALRVLNHCLSDNAENCREFIRQKGLKAIFSVYMRKEKRAKPKYHAEEDTNEEHIISIFVQLFIHLSDIDYARLLRKFQENECEKIDRLIELHDKYLTRFENSEKTLVQQPDDVDKEQLYYARLEKGLFALQLIDLVIGLVCSAGDKKMKERVYQVLHQQDSDINDVKRTLTEYHAHLGTDETGVSMSTILPAVLNFL
uniref:Beta-catenin-like protein 1 n=2 Tax=Hirondellea gigas TaxID=1518452 RepID=A0A6A7G4X4_9CRUS